MNLEKLHQNNSHKSFRNLPNVPVVQDAELMPTVEKYVNYDEYHKTIFPFLLLETWEEISKAYRDNIHSKKTKTYNNTPIWFKEIDKSKNLNGMNFLICQSK